MSCLIRNEELDIDFEKLEYFAFLQIEKTSDRGSNKARKSKLAVYVKRLKAKRMLWWLLQGNAEGMSIGFPLHALMASSAAQLYSSISDYWVDDLMMESLSTTRW